MANVTWNSWKAATIGIAVVVTTALVTAVVVGNWNSKEAVKPVSSTSKAAVRQVATKPSAPSASDIDACNQRARSVASGTTSDTTKDVLTKAVIGGAIGAGVGAAGGAIAGGGKGAGKGAAIGGIVGATAGTLYGLNDASKNDARSVEAYRACMQQRGYTN